MGCRTAYRTGCWVAVRQSKEMVVGRVAERPAALARKATVAACVAAGVRRMRWFRVPGAALPLAVAPGPVRDAGAPDPVWSGDLRVGDG
jgi:hypothetical protein